MDSGVVLVVFGGVFGILALYGLFVMTSQNRRGFDFDYDDPNLVWKELQRDSQTQALERRIANAEQTATATVGKTTSTPFPTKPQTFPKTGTSKISGKAALQIALVGIVAIIGGAIAAGYAFINWTEYEDSANWLTTNGTITDASIEEEYDSEDSEYSYEPQITYEYEVNGTVYESDRIGFFGKSYGTRAEAQQVINDYQGSGGVEVHYNPDNPEKAVLERTTDETLLAGLGIAGGIGVVVGLGMVLFGLLRGLRAASSF